MSGLLRFHHTASYIRFVRFSCREIREDRHDWDRQRVQGQDRQKARQGRRQRFPRGGQGLPGLLECRKNRVGRPGVLDYRCRVMDGLPIDQLEGQGGPNTRVPAPGVGAEILLGKNLGTVAFSQQVAKDELRLALADDQPPSLANFGFEPRTVYSESPQAINFTAHVIDDESGMWASAAYFASPSRNQTAMALFRPENRTLGNSKDGVYTAQMRLPKDGNNEIEKGYWQLVNLTMVDGENNRRILQEDDMARQGLPDRLLVI